LVVAGAAVGHRDHAHHVPQSAVHRGQSARVKLGIIGVRAKNEKSQRFIRSHKVAPKKKEGKCGSKNRLLENDICNEVLIALAEFVVRLIIANWNTSETAS
jgi:hypothetical protein